MNVSLVELLLMFLITDNFRTFLIKKCNIFYSPTNLIEPRVGVLNWHGFFERTLCIILNNWFRATGSIWQYLKFSWYSNITSNRTVRIFEYKPSWVKVSCYIGWTGMNIIKSTIWLVLVNLGSQINSLKRLLPHLIHYIMLGFFG